MSITKSVVILASDFPPLAGTNIMRVQGFAKHLCSYGWSPVIFTCSISDLPAVDMRQLDHLPSSLVINRINSPDPFLWMKRRRSLTPCDVSSINVDGVHEDTAYKPVSHANTRLREFARFPISLASACLKSLVRAAWYCPDAMRPWSDRAARSAIKYIKRHHADVLFTSSPAYSCHVSGIKIKASSGIPWVADFRDLWVNRPGRVAKKGLHGLREKRLESDVVKYADKIIIASSFWEDNFASRYGEWIREKIVYLPTGYDKSVIPEPTKEKDNNSITFVYTGAMYNTESPSPFLIALGELHDEYPGILDRVKVRLIGYAGDDLPYLQKIVDDLNIGSHVEMPGTLSREQCLSEQANADLLLLFNGPEHFETIRGKTYEYLAHGKPILALVPKGGAQDKLLRDSGIALIADYSDIAAIKAILKDVILNNVHTDLKANWEYIEKFNMESITKSLSSLLDEVCNPASV